MSAIFVHQMTGDIGYGIKIPVFFEGKNIFFAEKFGGMKKRY